MTSKVKRRRLTVASLMTCIAAVALLLALALPVWRQGHPPCLSSSATARWLLSRPGTASCTNCHGLVSLVDRARAFVPEFAVPTPDCPAARAQGPTSCITCHAR
jgi:hypothetical protein